MSLKIFDRVKETASFSGTTSPITLLGAATDFHSFTSVLSNGDTTYYAINDTTNNQWEIGIGTFTTSGTTLSRDTVLSNSAGTTSVLSFTSGTKDVYITLPASVAVATGIPNTFTATQTVQKSGIAATATDAVILDNPTASTSGVPVQLSPSLHLKSHVWNTGSTADNTMEMRMYLKPVSGLSPTSQLILERSNNGGSWTQAMSVADNGTVIFPAYVNASGVNASTIDASSGYTQNFVAFSGTYLRGNGTTFIGDTIKAGDLPVFVASGASHAAGAVPDPGVTSGTTKFLREDATWATPSGGGSSPLTTKGDIYTHSTVDARLPVGSNGQVLAADSTQTLGLKWATGGLFTENLSSLTSQTLLANNGYILTSSSLATGTLDVTYSVGDVIAVLATGAAGADIAQNSGQTIHGDVNTTTGVSGKLHLATNAVVYLKCTTANTDFEVMHLEGTVTTDTAAAVRVRSVTMGGTGASTLTAHGVVIGNGTSAVNVTSAGTKGWALLSNGASADPTFQGPVTAQSTPSAPTGTTSTTGVMMGLAGTITPTGSGTIVILISGDISNTTTSGAKVQIRYGTGSAPANAAALTGTTAGGLVQLTKSVSDTLKVPFSLNAIVTGLTAGTAVWLDVGLAAITAGTASIGDVSITAFEL